MRNTVPVITGVTMIWIQAAVLAVTAFAGSLHTLVLTTGERLSVDSGIRVEEGLVVFRARGGPLYSIPLTEVDLERTEKANEGPRRVAEPAGRVRSTDQARLDLEKMFADRSLSSREIVVSEDEKRRLIDEAARSRGVPAPPPPMPEGTSIEVEAPRSDTTRDEWAWRERSRSFHERVRYAKEELQLLVDKERRLQDEILGLLSLGYDPNQFNLQVLSLAHTRDSIPRAQLNLQRAERDLAQFKDDARRQGILPGWLR